MLLSINGMGYVFCCGVVAAGRKAWLYVVDPVHTLPARLLEELAKGGPVHLETDSNWDSKLDMASKENKISKISHRWKHKVYCRLEEI